jgi:heme A synthase
MLDPEMLDPTKLLPSNVGIGLAVAFFVFLMLLLYKLLRRRPAGVVAALSVVLGMFLAYQVALGLFR